MSKGRWIITGALHDDNTLVFGITIGKLDRIKAIGFVLNLGYGGIIIGYKL